MTPSEQKKIKSAIVKTLKEQNIYNKAFDENLIDNLIFNLVLIADAKRDILSRGNLVNLCKEGEEPYYQINFSISIFHNAVKSVNTILKQLGLEKVKVETDVTADALQQLNEIIRR